jgi:hypothetical protein
MLCVASTDGDVLIGEIVSDDARDLLIVEIDDVELSNDRKE